MHVQEAMVLPPRRYRVLRKAMLRESAARDSEPCGSLAVRPPDPTAAFAPAEKGRFEARVGQRTERGVCWWQVGDSVTSLRAVEDGAGVRVQVRHPHTRARPSDSLLTTFLSRN